LCDVAGRVAGRRTEYGPLRDGLSLIPQPKLKAPEGSVKTLHLLAYGAIATCAGLGLANWNRRYVAGFAAIRIGIFLKIAQAA